MAAEALLEASEASRSSSLGEEVFELGHPLPAGLLYRRCDPAELPFALCSELEEAPELIGRERAVEALNFALRVRRKEPRQIGCADREPGSMQHYCRILALDRSCSPPRAQWSPRRSHSSKEISLACFALSKPLWLLGRCRFPASTVDLPPSVS